MNYRGGINGDKFDGALAQAQAMVRRFEGQDLIKGLSPAHSSMNSARLCPRRLGDARPANGPAARLWLCLHFLKRTPKYQL